MPSESTRSGPPRPSLTEAHGQSLKVRHSDRHTDTDTGPQLCSHMMRGTHRTATHSQTLLQAKLCPSPNPRVEILTPRNSECDCICNQSFRGVTKVN